MPALRGFVGLSRNTLAHFEAVHLSFFIPEVLFRASTQLNLKFADSALCDIRRVGVCLLSILTSTYSLKYKFRVN